jgi:hypothetical protein
MGFPRAGSNPAGCEEIFLTTKRKCSYKSNIMLVDETTIKRLLQKIFKSNFARCGVRTHAILRLWELKSHALDHSANRAVNLFIIMLKIIKGMTYSKAVKVDPIKFTFEDTFFVIMQNLSFEDFLSWISRIFYTDFQGFFSCQNSFTNSKGVLYTNLA